MQEDLQEEVENMDTSHEGTSDPNYNDCLFVEDDCDEIEDDVIE